MNHGGLCDALDVDVLGGLPGSVVGGSAGGGVVVGRGGGGEVRGVEAGEGAGLEG